MRWVFGFVVLVWGMGVSQEGLIISEVVDGTNFGGTPKYVEIYNAHATNTYSLGGLQIRRYANGNTSPASVNLSNVNLAPGQTWVVADGPFDPAWGGAFATATPDQTNGSVISGNGDDVYELYNTGTGTVIDVYGVVGVDGTGQPWEYTDSQVTRHTSVNRGNGGNFNVAEWSIVPYNNLNATPGSHSVDTPLPVELTSFTATAGDGEVILRWVTESEVQNLGFEILRAMEASEVYQQIGFVDGQFTTTQRTEYEFRDERVVNGVTYRYKLVDVDVFGRRTEHGPVMVTPRAGGAEVTTLNSGVGERFYLYPNYPNPFNPTTTLRFEVPAAKAPALPVSIAVFDVNGRRICTLFEGNLEPGLHA
ncbi:MAG: lamin tail domain-containing protein, partial [Calditrichaeota bacterium]